MPAVDTMEIDAVDISGDGGVRKRILVEGTGTETAPEGSNVFVHYVGTLQSDGSEFDSSRKRNDPFSFKLGIGSVIKGWDKGVATMRKGEKAVLTCRADYAYGESGSPPRIPGGATLDFEVELLHWVDGDDLSGDGEVVKKVMEKGTGWKSPKHGEKATIKYKGTLADGTIFVDSSSTPCVFVVGEDTNVPEAVHLAVKKMHVGEKARVQSSGKYANGNDAVFEIELIGWREMVTVGTEGGISKIISQQGSGYETPNAGAMVTLMIGEGENSEMEERKVVLGEGQLPDAVDQAVLGMKKGERAQLHVQLIAQDPDIEKVTDGVKIWELELKDFEKAKENWSMSPSEKLENCERLKGQGTDFFKQGKIRVGLRLYRRAAQLVESDSDDMSDDQKSTRRELSITCHLNLALCNLKLKHFKETITECNKVLAMDPDNFKALSRRGCSYSGLGEWDEAKIDLTRAHEIDSNDKVLKKELATVVMKIKNHEEKEKAVFAKMFA